MGSFVREGGSYTFRREKGSGVSAAGENMEAEASTTDTYGRITTSDSESGAGRGCGALGAEVAKWSEEALLFSSDYLDRVLGGLSLLARCASKSICLRALS
jgi:hypothetical protein